MMNLLVIGLGGGIGSVCRYLLSGTVQRISGDAWFPYGTLCVNLLGCLLAGWLGGWAEHREVFSPEVRLFLMVGVLGGFTTYSTFGYETVALMREAQLLAALASVLAHVGLGLVAAWAGYAASLAR